MNDTPRTDEQINGKPCTRFAIMAGDSLRDATVPSEFARTLERENAALREALAGVLPIFSGKYLLTSEHEMVANARSILANEKPLA